MSSLFPPINNCAKLPPQIKTLLLKGSYHASAPIHFCLSSSYENSSILISPCRRTFTAALEEFNDSWIDDHGGDGTVAGDLSRIKVFYPPTPAHLALLLSMLHCPRSSDAPDTNRKVVLDASPSYIVLHEISAFFLEQGSENTCTMSSYLTLIAEALAAASFLSTNGSSAVGLVLFDSRLDQLMLPVVQPPPQDYSLVEDDRIEDSSCQTFSVAMLTGKYFEWIGDFNTTDEDPGRYTMKLCGPQQEEFHYSWYIQKESSRGRNSSDRESRTFIFSRCGCE